MLITNDGALAHRLLSPVKHVPKTYLVHTKKPVTSQMCEKLEAGVEIGDETPTAPAKTKLLSDTDCGLLLTITEGRFHQVKRMLQAVGNEVVYLKRLSMGVLVLDETLSKGKLARADGRRKSAAGRVNRRKGDNRLKNFFQSRDLMSGRTGYKLDMGKKRAQK